MSQSRIEELSTRMELLHARAAALHKDSRNSATRLSNVSQGLIARLPRAEAIAESTLAEIDPERHAALFRDALQAEMDMFRDDFKRVSEKALALPTRIQALASGTTLDTLENSLTDLQQDVAGAFDGVSGLIDGRLSSEAFVARAEQALETFEEMAGALGNAAEETKNRLEAVADQMEAMASSVEEVSENAADVLAETWNGRAELLEEAFEGHVLSFGTRAEQLEAKFAAVEARVVAVFETLSELRNNLTELTEDNAGPGENLVDALGVISETLSSVSG